MAGTLKLDVPNARNIRIWVKHSGYWYNTRWNTVNILCIN
jgi:hypothetical protein